MERKGRGTGRETVYGLEGSWSLSHWGSGDQRERAPQGSPIMGRGGICVHPSVPFLLEAARGHNAWTSGLQALADGESPRQRLAVLCGGGGGASSCVLFTESGFQPGSEGGDPLPWSVF